MIKEIFKKHNLDVLNYKKIGGTVTLTIKFNHIRIIFLNYIQMTIQLLR